MPRHANHLEGGFTLVETLAGLAIASVVLITTAALIRNVALYFDRGTQGVSNADRTILGIDRLAADLGAAQFILQTTSAGMSAAFIGTSKKVVFVAPPIQILQENESLTGGEQLITLTIESQGDVSRLIRRRAEWRGPRTDLEEIVLQDAVMLLEGQFDAAFAFAKTGPNGVMSWGDKWIGELALPRLVRLSLRDRRTGLDLVAGNEFVIHSDGSPACALPNAKSACLNAGENHQGNSVSSPKPTSSP